MESRSMAQNQPGPTGRVTYKIHPVVGGGKFTTWFGPETAPLLGTLHVPAGGTARGGVVLCPPVGKEHVDSYRGLVLLAQKLCAQGHLVLRFDYYCTGDSSGEQTQANAVELWESSVREAAGYLRRCGTDTVTVLGLRVGALVGARAAADIDGVNALVLWDPVVSGRKFLHRQKALVSLTSRTDAEQQYVSLIGMALHRSAAQQLSNMDLTSTPIDSSVRVLIATRPEHADNRGITRLVERTDAEHFVVDEQIEFIEPADFAVRVPAKTITSIADWIDAATTRKRSSVAVQLRDSANLVDPRSGRTVTEQLSHRGTHNMFTIQTTPAGSAPGGPTLVVYGTASEHRVGPSRLWVELARALAAHGVSTIRFDRASTGETWPADDHEISTIYTPEQRTDAVDVVELAGAPAGNLIVAGLCSGSWSAAIAAAEVGARHAILVNPLRWTTRQIEFTRSHELAGDVPGKRSLALRAHDAAVRFKDVIRDRLPYRLWLQLGQIGLVQVPEVLLRPLSIAGVNATVLLSPGDHRWFLENRGPTGLSRLQQLPGSVDTRLLPAGDHPLIGYPIRESARAEMTSAILDAFGIRETTLPNEPQDFANAVGIAR
ncbi:MULTISPECIES: hypothetical protein [Rhodococcus]|nr:hypothetical protein [Rhodococcus globerulus]QXW02197.1 hypothetical protein KYT97_28730 [Rhodococcus globerulus]ROZ43870.1 alpha/beta hydrolase [Rhodococcus sp. WS3]